MGEETRWHPDTALSNQVRFVGDVNANFRYKDPQGHLRGTQAKDEGYERDGRYRPGNSSP